MGFTLLIFACLTANSTACGPFPVAGGFSVEAQCNAYAHLMLLGWGVEHPTYTVERIMCTDKPEYVIGRWMT